MLTGAVIGTADLDDTESLESAVRGTDVMFLVTHYWEHMDKEKETQQVCYGYNTGVRTLPCTRKCDLLVHYCKHLDMTACFLPSTSEPDV